MKSLYTSALLLALALVVPAFGVLAPAGSAIPGASGAPHQSGSTRLLPPIVQPGKVVAAANKAQLAGSVVFRPSRKGRPVTIQRRVAGGAWQNVTRKRQNRLGVVQFRAAARTRAGKWYTYRGVASRWNGLPRVRSKAQSAGVWKRTFSDDFTGQMLDLTKWSYRQVGVYSASANRACSASSPDAVKVKDGRVLLSMMADDERDLTGPCQGEDHQGNALQDNDHWYKNGHISTEHGLAGRFRYGVAAARVKFDKHVGAHGGFWMQSTVRDIPGEGPESDGAEIDIVEYFGKRFKQGDVYHCLHYRDAAGRYHKLPDDKAGCLSPKARRALTSRRDDWFKSYHVFSVEWTPKGYTFRVDGIKTRRITEGVSGVPEFLVLSMISSGWEVARVDRSTLPNSTQVDWVRFWQK